jgi:hypothetical protein
MSLYETDQTAELQPTMAAAMINQAQQTTA